MQLTRARQTNNGPVAANPNLGIAFDNSLDNYNNRRTVLLIDGSRKLSKG